MNSKYGQALVLPLVLGLLCGAVKASAADELHVSHPPGIELPAGEGRVLLLAACTRCHDLKGLPAYKGYWNSAHWRDMIQSMVKNGAPLNPEQVDLLAEYLAEYFGRPTP